MLSHKRMTYREFTAWLEADNHPLHVIPVAYSGTSTLLVELSEVLVIWDATETKNTRVTGFQDALSRS